MEHKCEANSYGKRIFQVDSGQWYIGGRVWQDYYTITHCPYCGLKLEESDAKIEVSKRRLQSWINRCEHLQQLLEYNEVVCGPMYLKMLAGRIRQVMLTDD